MISHRNEALITSDEQTNLTGFKNLSGLVSDLIEFSFHSVSPKFLRIRSYCKLTLLNQLLSASTLSILFCLVSLSALALCGLTKLKLCTPQYHLDRVLVLCQCSFDGCRSPRFILEKAQTKVWTPTGTRQNKVDRVLGHFSF